MPTKERRGTDGNESARVQPRLKVLRKTNTRRYERDVIFPHDSLQNFPISTVEWTSRDGNEGEGGRKERIGFDWIHVPLALDTLVLDATLESRCTIFERIPRELKNGRALGILSRTGWIQNHLPSKRKVFGPLA